MASSMLTVIYTYVQGLVCIYHVKYNANTYVSYNQSIDPIKLCFKAMCITSNYVGNEQYV